MLRTSFCLSPGQIRLIGSVYQHSHYDNPVMPAHAIRARHEFPLVAMVPTSDREDICCT